MEKIKLCFIDFSINFLSFKDSTAASWASRFTLNGGLIIFRAFTIFLEPYPHPTLNEAKPNIFEKVLKIKTLSLFLNKSKPDL